ncbi:hypothetical protein GCM10009850_006140 [Nonomuraea monospora]|uniref:Uncharacterized protein n=1 Tax=Nonomuraea monospora TaxID=568818 RepID=A0ABN3C6N5_9ACTN
MSEIPDFHGPHVDPPRPDHVKLTWYALTRRAPRVRVVSHTCECRETTYELCAAAGLGFVRRTDRTVGTVRETAWTSPAAAGCLFEQIMQGEVR